MIRKLNEKERKIIKPYYTTNELHRFYGNPSNRFWVIYTKSDMNRKIDEYPSIKAHLDQFKEIITSDFGPYGLHRARDERFFTGEKIISLRKCSRPTFTHTSFDSYVSQTYFVIKTKRVNMKYLVGLLNSKPIAFWLFYKGKLQGNQYQVDKEPLLNIPIPQIPESEQKPFEELVDIILEKKERGEDTTTEERKIDEMVYKLYGLTEEEIEVVENFNNGR